MFVNHDPAPGSSRGRVYPHRFRSRTPLSCAPCPLCSASRTRRTSTASRQSRRLEAIGRLTGGVAHDFNNLLTVILSAMETLAEAELLPEDRRLAEVSLEAAERGADLIRRLLAFTRPGPRSASGATSTDAGAAVETAARLLQRTLPEKMALEAKGPDGLVYCRADRSELENVLLNLCINSRDAMPEGGRLSLTATLVALDRLQAQRLGAKAGDYVRFRVEDSGVGMAPETLARAHRTVLQHQERRWAAPAWASAPRTAWPPAPAAPSTSPRATDQGTCVDLYIPRARAAAQTELDLGSACARLPFLRRAAGRRRSAGACRDRASPARHGLRRDRSRRRPGGPGPRSPPSRST
ncbi:MAG: histidine kinase dimerization/phospho-acceptor domain-containing protein [Caulobacteraceae bacterium]